MTLWFHMEMVFANMKKDVTDTSNLWLTYVFNSIFLLDTYSLEGIILCDILFDVNSKI